jgi:hypothetical protein
MIEIFDLIASSWDKSKREWNRNRYKLFTFFAFILTGYLVLEIGSYIFTERLNEAKNVEAIRAKFMDRRIDLANEFVRNFFILKENTRTLIREVNKQPFSQSVCNKINNNVNVKELESNLFISGSNLRYFFGDEITDEFVEFIAWYDEHDNNCFQNVSNAENEVDKRILSIREKMWEKMYPPEVIKGVR